VFGPVDVLNHPHRRFPLRSETAPPSHDRSGAEGPGHFFAVDRRAWATACRVGLNPAVAYLVLARFTWRDNRTTKAGTNAVEQHTGIARLRAKAAITQLVAAGLLTKPEGSSTMRTVVAAHEVPRCEGFRQPLDGEEQAAVELVRSGARVPKWQRWRAEAAAGKGWLGHVQAGLFEVLPEPSREPDWIWLPNAIVDGAAAEVPPVEQVRKSNDVLLLKLLVDLYHAQCLSYDGGIHFRTIRQEFKRAKVGRLGSFDIWGFVADTERMWPKPPFLQFSSEREGWGEAVWPRWSALRGLGLVQVIPHLVEADSDDAEVIHPYGMPQAGEAAERELGEAAHQAGRSLISQAQWERAATELGNWPWLAPIPRQITGVQMVGIARLRYRARTTATAAWYSRMADWRKRAEEYRALCQGAAAGPRAVEVSSAG